MKRSAGLLMYRITDGELEVFLVHPGGPFFSNKDEGAWSIPKGEIEPGDEPFEVAMREFREETGQEVRRCAAAADYINLGSIVQKNGKRVQAWAFKGHWPDGASLQSNLFQMEWPPRSGKIKEFPEVDQGTFFKTDEAKVKINPAQSTFLDRLKESLEA